MPIARNQQITWLPGRYYHIYNRGARQKSIFKTSENYLYCLRTIKKYTVRFNLTLIAYCLMPNHYHFLVRQNSDYEAGLLPTRTFLTYTQAFNRFHKTSGTLFEGRYKAKSVDTTRYLLYLCKYIHFNPVKDGFVTAPEAWPYSNYLEWIGERTGFLFDAKFVIDQFGGAEAYRAEMNQFLVDKKFDTFDLD